MGTRFFAGAGKVNLFHPDPNFLAYVFAFDIKVYWVWQRGRSPHKKFSVAITRDARTGKKFPTTSNKKLYDTSYKKVFVRLRKVYWPVMRHKSREEKISADKFRLRSRANALTEKNFIHAITEVARLVIELDPLPPKSFHSTPKSFIVHSRDARTRSSSLKIESCSLQTDNTPIAHDTS